MQRFELLSLEIRLHLNLCNFVCGFNYDSKEVFCTSRTLPSIDFMLNLDSNLFACCEIITFICITPFTDRANMKNCGAIKTLMRETVKKHLPRDNQGKRSRIKENDQGKRSRVVKFNEICNSARLLWKHVTRIKVLSAQTQTL